MRMWTSDVPQATVAVCGARSSPSYPSSAVDRGRVTGEISGKQGSPRRIFAKRTPLGSYGGWKRMLGATTYATTECEDSVEHRNLAHTSEPCLRDIVTNVGVVRGKQFQRAIFLVKPMRHASRR
jgi:hypothetical protein